MKLTTRLILPILVAAVLATIALVTAWSNGQELSPPPQETEDSTYSDIQIFDKPYVSYNTTICLPTIKPMIYTPAPTPIPPPEPEPVAYQEIADKITEAEIETLARLLFLEAGNQSVEGQRAVIEVVFNRVMSEEFPNTIDEVVYAKNQFSPAHLIPSTTATEQQYEVIEMVLTSTDTVLDYGVVFFSRGQYNEYLFDKIGDHYFCYSTNSYQNKMKGTTEP